jgi:hypothetical protein
LLVEFVKKQPRYPETYEECCKVLGIDSDNFLSIRNLYRDDGDEETTDYESDLLEKFDHLRELTICRDAYWKIAGKELGLGTPWRPDWESASTTKYTISQAKNKIRLLKAHEYHYILSFPTAEIRNTFYKNFKYLIESCKELLC